MNNNDTKTIKASEKLVNAIIHNNNVKAEQILTSILTKKIDKRYDEVLNK